jgi:indole-3-glycerol phosphate synthase
LQRGDQAANAPDVTVDKETFSLIRHIPKNAIKVAESGLRPSAISEVIQLGYDAVLVGTSLLKAPQGLERMLAEFEEAVSEASQSNPVVN